MKNKIKNNKKQFISLFLIVALLITSIFAFLTAKDTKDNIFTVGSVDINLEENFDRNHDGYLYDLQNDEYIGTQPPENYEPASGIGYDEVAISGGSTKHETYSMFEKVEPNDNVLKQPYVKNTGANDAYVFMQVGIPKTEPGAIRVESANGTPVSGNTPFEIVTPAAISSDWALLGQTTQDEDYNYYLYYYKYALSSNTSTPHLFESVNVVNYGQYTTTIEEMSANFDAGTDPDEMYDGNHFAVVPVPGVGTAIALADILGKSENIDISLITSLTLNNNTINIAGLAAGVDPDSGASYYAYNNVPLLAVLNGVSYIIVQTDGNGDSLYDISIEAEREVEIENIPSLDFNMPITGYAIQTDGFGTSPVDAWMGIVANYQNTSPDTLRWFGDVDGFYLGIADGYVYNTVNVSFLVPEENNSPSGDNPRSGYTVVTQITVPAGQPINYIYPTTSYQMEGYVFRWVDENNNEVAYNSSFNEDTDVYLEYTTAGNLTYAAADWFQWEIKTADNGNMYAIPKYVYNQTNKVAMNVYSSTITAASGTYVMPASITVTLTGAYPMRADDHFSHSSSYDGYNSAQDYYQQITVNGASYDWDAPYTTVNNLNEYCQVYYDSNNVVHKEYIRGVEAGESGSSPYSYHVLDWYGSGEWVRQAKVKSLYPNDPTAMYFDAPLIANCDHNNGIRIPIWAKFIGASGRAVSNTTEPVTITIPVLYPAFNANATNWNVWEVPGTRCTSATVTFSSPIFTATNNGYTVNYPTVAFSNS